MSSEMVEEPSQTAAIPAVPEAQEAEGECLSPQLATQTADNTEWPNHLVLLLIEEYRNHADEMLHRNAFKSSRITKKAVWQKIAIKLGEHGHSNITWLACDKKFRNLKIR